MGPLPQHLSHRFGVLQVLVVHVAGARDQPSELLASMEEGAMETRRQASVTRVHRGELRPQKNKTNRWSGLVQLL